MRFLVDTQRKFMIGYTAKAGCTHLKHIFYYMRDGALHDDVHVVKLTGLTKDVQDNIGAYTVLIVVRNPYERLVSGFLDKYHPVRGEFREKWGSGTLTFAEFVQALVAQDWERVDENHFAPQTQARRGVPSDWHAIVQRAKRCVVCDLKKIDYTLIERVYDKQIPADVLAFRGNHVHKAQTKWTKRDVHTLDMAAYCDLKVPVQRFYPRAIKDNVDVFFAEDFAFAAQYGHVYKCGPTV